MVGSIKQEIDLKWVMEDLWSAICTYLHKYLTAQGQIDLRHIDTEFRKLLINQFEKEDD